MHHETQKTDIKPKEATFQVVLDALALTPFYQAFLITADVPAIYMQEFWATVSVHKSSIRFTINKKKVSLDVDMFREILQFALKFQDKSLKTSYWNMIFSLSLEILGTLEISFISLIHEDTQVYGTILPKELTNQAMLGSNACKTYYAPKLNGSGDGVDTQSKVPDEQQQNTSGTDEGTDEDENDENNSDDISDEGDDDHDSNNGNDGDDDDANDDDKQEGDDTNDDDEETDSDRTESDIIKIPILD
ncbi:hypothetical protein Tco_1502353 [Tanacetum coccineum]